MTRVEQEAHAWAKAQTDQTYYAIRVVGYLAGFRKALELAAEIPTKIAELDGDPFGTRTAQAIRNLDK